MRGGNQCHAGRHDDEARAAAYLHFRRRRANQKVELAMLGMMARIVVGMTLGVLFLLVMACGFAVDLIETEVRS